MTETHFLNNLRLKQSDLISKMFTFAIDAQFYSKTLIELFVKQNGTNKSI